ncbi:hypothetical protein C8Q80DRAFT_1097891, partial [Daedaleopsis nitida]
PDVKVDQKLLQSDDFLLRVLGWDMINHRYPIPVPRDISRYGFTRDFISDQYGGSTQSTCPKIGKRSLDQHGLDDWMFLTLEWNPHVPTKPGFPGLLFSFGRETDEWKKIQRVFVRVQTDPAQWVYMGQYQMKVGTSLTAADWWSQKEQSRKKWANGVLKKGWGAKLCARLGLQKQHGVAYEPTKSDYDIATKKDNIKHYRSLLTERDVLRAFDSRDVVRSVLCHTCRQQTAERTHRR